MLPPVLLAGSTPCAEAMKQEVYENGPITAQSVGSAFASRELSMSARPATIRVATELRAVPWVWLVGGRAVCEVMAPVELHRRSRPAMAGFVCCARS